MRWVGNVRRRWCIRNVHETSDREVEGETGVRKRDQEDTNKIELIFTVYEQFITVRRRKF